MKAATAQLAALRGHSSGLTAPLPGLAALLALAALLTMGCAAVVHPVDYPSQWVSLQSPALPDGCPDLAGTYRTGAADAHPDSPRTRPGLNDLFQPAGTGAGIFAPHPPGRTWPTLPGATTAAFEVDGDALQVRLRDAASGEAVLRFHRIRFVSAAQPDAFFDCHASDAGPALRFVGPSTTLGGVPYVYGERDMAVLTLFRATDGSLVVNRRTDRLVLTTLIVGSQRQARDSAWWRYPVVRPTR